MTRKLILNKLFYIVHNVELTISLACKEVESA